MKASLIVNTELERLGRLQVSREEYKAAKEEAEQGRPDDVTSKEEALRFAIEEGLSGGVAEDFDPAIHLSELKRNFRHA